MKINVKGDAPMERLSNFMKRVAVVDKAEIVKLEKKWRVPKSRKKR